MTGFPSKRHTQGFTLIEVLVAVAVFSITTVMAVNLFIIFVQQQRRTLNQQELQNDARSVMEQVAKDVREGSIDYEYYATAPLTTQKKLFSELSSQAGNDDCLVLRNAVNEQILYRLNNEIVERLVLTTPVTSAGCSSFTDWEKISPDILEVVNFTFTIAPTEDPFAAQAAQVCGTTTAPIIIPSDASCRWGTICLDPADSTCINERGGTCYCYPQKYGDVAPLHPRVTFSFKMSRTSNQQTISQTFQTTVASRLFKNLDRLNSYVP
ncbi:MAG: prepilin-type N-terminal cleavage/methylation domain-containing protein [Patescibacteria group bacterium]|mgnify:CR=1 FL=1